MLETGARLEPAVYGTTEICELFDCSPNEVPTLMEAGVIPPPLPTTGPRGRRRWLKSAVNRKLGLTSPERKVLSELVRAQVRRVLVEQGVAA